MIQGGMMMIQIMGLHSRRLECIQVMIVVVKTLI